jgi:hypothetical protein
MDSYIGTSRPKYHAAISIQLSKATEGGECKRTKIIISPIAAEILNPIAPHHTPLRTVY